MKFTQLPYYLSFPFFGFVEKSKLEKISAVQACLIIRSFLKSKALNNILASWNTFSYFELRYWLQTVIYIL